MAVAFCRLPKVCNGLKPRRGILLNLVYFFFNRYEILFTCPYINLKNLAKLNFSLIYRHPLIDSLRLLRDMINRTSYSITWALKRKRFIYSL